MPATQAPVLVWETSGGSRPGSLWRVGAQGLLWATRGKELPGADGTPVYTIKDRKLKLNDCTPKELLAELFELKGG